jgi:hypothetical protein
MTTSCGLAANQTLSISASTTAAGASIGWDFVRDAGGGSTAEANAVLLGGSPTAVLTRTSGLTEFGAGEFVYRDPNTTISIDFRYSVGDLTKECQVFGTALQA